ncbi:UNVERIFIED_CONTAM: DNA-binding response OmpR family regulator [Paenibacillus sp. PvR008]
MSAKDSDVDKALELGFGADDYVAKPFSMVEMTARIQSAIRRATTYARQQQQEEQPKAQVLTYGSLHIDFEHFMVRKGEVRVHLTAKESDILKLFVTHPNRVFTKAQLYGFIWKEDYMGDENVINVHIRRLREKIEEDPSHPIHIKTLWGVGYKWENG